MVEVPLGIWLCIASFIPDNDLYYLREVNRLFFNLAINAQWSKTRISSDITWYKTLERLSDPFIARKISNLAIYLTHDKSTAQDNARLYKLLRTRIRVSHKALCNLFLQKQGESHRKEATRRCTLKDVIDMVSASNGNFPNVRELSVDGCLFFSQAPTPLPNLSSSFWRPFAANLCVLSLGGTMEEFQFMLESGYTFETLKELHLRFEQSYDGEGEASVFVNNVAPFINVMNIHLEFLRIWSRCSLDMSDFFASLSSFGFPALRFFEVKMLVPQSLQNSAGLETIIRNTSLHLEKLSLRHSSHSLRSGLEPSYDNLWNLSFSRWLIGFAAIKDNFPRVQVLDIYPIYTPTGIRVFLDIIHRASDRLTEIIIRNRFLPQDEAMLIIDAASNCSNLVYLRLEVHSLDLTLLDYLAIKVPDLPRMYIAIGEQNPQCFEELKKLNGRQYTH